MCPGSAPSGSVARARAAAVIAVALSRAPCARLDMWAAASAGAAAVRIGALGLDVPVDLVGGAGMDRDGDALRVVGGEGARGPRRRSLVDLVLVHARYLAEELGRVTPP